jgi:hypothetical protein
VVQSQSKPALNKDETKKARREPGLFTALLIDQQNTQPAYTTPVVASSPSAIRANFLILRSNEQIIS